MSSRQPLLHNRETLSQKDQNNNTNTVRRYSTSITEMKIKAMIKLSNTFTRIDKFKGWKGRQTPWQLRALAALPKDPSQVPCVHINPGFWPIHIISAPQKAQTGGSLELVAASPARKTRTPDLGQILPLKDRQRVTAPVTFFWPPHVLHMHILTHWHTCLSNTPCCIWIPQDNENHIYSETDIKTFPDSLFIFAKKKCKHPSALTEWTNCSTPSVKLLVREKNSLQEWGWNQWLMGKGTCHSTGRPQIPRVHMVEAYNPKVIL